MRSAVWGGADYPVTQPFNPAVHTGIDIGCPSGTTIYAARAGVVERVQTGMVGVRVGNQRDFYLHGTSLVAVGQQVAQGQPVIHSDTVQVDPRYPLTGPHLHFEVQNGYSLPGAPPSAPEAPLDPVPVLTAALAYGAAATSLTGGDDDMVYIGAKHAKAATLIAFVAGSAYRERTQASPATRAFAKGAAVAVIAYCYSTAGVASPDLSGSAGAQPGTDFCWWLTPSGDWVPDAILDTSKLAGAPTAAIPAGEAMNALFATREELAGVAANIATADDDSTLATKADLDALAAKIPTKVVVTATLGQ